MEVENKKSSTEYKMNQIFPIFLEWLKCFSKCSDIIPNTKILQENNKLALIRVNGLSMPFIKESPMTHQEMRKITTLGCHKNLTKQAHRVVKSCQLGGKSLHKDDCKH